MSTSAAAAAAVLAVSDAPVDPYTVLTPFDAEILLKEHPSLLTTNPELVTLRDERSYYLTECNGLYKEGMRALVKRDVSMLNTLWSYASVSKNAGAQWQAVITLVYRDALANVTTVFLDWLNEKGVLFNIATFSADVMQSRNMDLHRWVAQAIKESKTNELEGRLPLAWSTLETALTIEDVARAKEGKKKKPVTSVNE